MAGESQVLEAFNTFDKDHSGSISTDELAAVLKSLDEEEWDEDSISQLLQQADSSGDGQLQIEEFVKWIFAENIQGFKAGLGSHDFKLAITGCSNRTLNGEYVQSKHFARRRPCFYCFANEHWLSYHPKQDYWQLIPRATPKRYYAFLKTKRAPHISGDAVWEVIKKKNGKVLWEKEPDMKCSLVDKQAAPPTEISTAGTSPSESAEKIYVDGWSQHFERLSGRVFCGRPVYYCEFATFYIFYHDRHSCWKMGKSVSLNGSYTYATSDSTRCNSPEQAMWKRQGRFLRLTASDPQPLPQVPEGWHDPDFPHDEHSLRVPCVREAQWVRALCFAGDSEPVLFGNPEPVDLLQGNVGDCWLIAAIAAVAEFPSYFEEQIFETKELATDGKYRIRLFNNKTFEWEVVQIDDYLPCPPLQNTGGRLQTVFGGCAANLSGNKLYVPLLEKAFAKMFGSYGALECGDSAMAIHMMTGSTQQYWCLRQRVNEHEYVKPVIMWQVGEDVMVRAAPMGQTLGRLAKAARFQQLDSDGCYVKFKKIDGDGPEEGWLAYYHRGKKMASVVADTKWVVCKSTLEKGGKTVYVPRSEYVYLSHDEMWQKLQEFDAANNLITCGVSMRGQGDDPLWDRLGGTVSFGVPPKSAWCCQL